MTLTHVLLVATVALLGADSAAPVKKPEAAKPAPPFKVQIDPKAGEVMDSLYRLYGNATRFSVLAHVVRRREVGDQKDLTEMSQRVYMEQPNKVTVAHHSGPALPSIYCDGWDMYLYDVERNVYSRHDPPRSLKDFYSSRRLGAIAMGAAFLGPVVLERDDPDRLAGILAMVYAGTEDVGGQMCHKIKVLNTSAPLIYWIATGDRPLLCKVALDSESALANLRKENPQAQNVDFEASVTYDEWHINEPFEKNPFKFKAPPASVQVESVLPTQTQAPKLAPPSEKTKSKKKKR